jgi:hypothetical protein
MYIRDLSSRTYNNHVHGEFKYRSVGWLGSSVTRHGATNPEVVGRLRELKAANQLPDLWRGLHTCAICVREIGRSAVVAKRGESSDKGEFYVELDNIRYVLPNMVLHYISQHGYQLPDVVEQAVLGNRRPSHWSRILEMIWPSGSHA